MDALVANYASDSDSDGDAPAATAGEAAPVPPEPSALLPPPPLDLLQPPNFVGMIDTSLPGVASGASHMWKATMRYMFTSLVNVNYWSFIAGCMLPQVVIPSDAKKHLALVMRRAASFVPDLYAIDADYALSELCKDEQKLEKVLLSREFHVHQIESLVAMLRQKFRSQQRYWMDFNKWEHFVNDDCTRSFLSLEVTSTGLPEISKQITMVDDVYRLHGLPEFYKNPRPHISLAWALGDVSCKLKQAIKEIEKSQSSLGTSQKSNLRCKFSHVVCKIGKKVYDICKLAD
uniref:U6 snRNA phosphodiesterase 1 n=1 Tax=Oryza nivara TaxID=4536 RepID=A0A0E0GAH0_ORYNI